MKASFYLFAAAAWMLAACSSDMKEEVTNEVMAPVTVRLSGFTIEQDEIPTRATAVGSYSGVKTLILAFYKTSDGSEVYKHTQIRTDATTFTTFGEFSTTLPVGDYTMVVIGHGGNNTLTLTSPTEATYGTYLVQDTFLATQAVTVSNGSAQNLSATLNRITSALAVQSTDTRPAEVTHMRFTYGAGGKGFSPATGLASTNTGFVNLVNHTGSAGTTTYTGGMLFLISDSQTMDVTIETLDANSQVVFTKTITDVPLKRNRVTKLTGAVYSNTSVSASSFQINETWLDDYNVNF